MTANSEQRHRYGLVIRGRLVPWDGIERRYLCRRCRHPVGRPYADPVTGELDFTRTVCFGPLEHEICEEGDLVPKGQHDWQVEREQVEAVEVRRSYGPPPERIAGLYAEADFDGFD
jgi:hypothetical protein